MAKEKVLRIKLIHSMHGHKPKHIACVKGLGLRRTNHVVECIDTLENRGMIKKVSHLLEVQEVES